MKLYDQKSNIFILTSPINKLTVHKIRAKKYVEKNKNILYTFNWLRRVKNIT